MDQLDTIALWVGYIVMGCGLVCLILFLVGATCYYFYVRMLRDVPSFLYLQRAFHAYKKTHPPGRWAAKAGPMDERLDDPIDD